MHVVIVSNLYPNSQEPQRGLFTYQIVNELKKLCAVTVVAPLPWVPPGLMNRGNGKFLHAKVGYREEIDGVTVFYPRYVVIPKISGFFHPLAMFFPLVKCLRSLERQRPIDLINAHWVFPDGVAAARVGHRLGKPVVLTALGCDVNSYATMTLRRMQLVRAMEQSDCVTAVSRGLRDAIIGLRIPENKVRLIRNGINLDMFHIVDRNEARKRLCLPEGKRIILAVGRQDGEKGTRYLMEAFAKLTHTIPTKCLLVLVGDGPLHNELVEQARALSISEDVLFAGSRPHSEISLWMNAADLFCLPSIREGHPNAAIEALACGIPVVASRVGEIPWMVGDESGLTVPAGDVQSLYVALMEALGKRWSGTAIRASVEDFDWKECAILYYRIYKEVLTNNVTVPVG